MKRGLLAIVASLLCACRQEDPQAAQGKATIRQVGCGSCHEIPGVPGAVGLVGPSLEGIASRLFVAGELPNTPENLLRWVREPRHVNPNTAMPDLGLSEADARAVCAYLYTLR
jgi:cytochrome c